MPRLCHCRLRNRLDANADVNSCYPARKNTSSYWHDRYSERYCRRIDQFTHEFLREVYLA